MLDQLNDRKLIGANGAPVEDDVNIQTIGPHGPAPSQDVWLIAKRFRSSARVRMMPVRTACAVAHGISRYTRAKTFTAIGRRLHVFRRSPVYLVRPTLLDSTTRWIFGESRRTSSTTRRQLCEGRIDIWRGHHGDMGAACGVVEASRAVRRHGIAASPAER